MHVQGLVFQKSYVDTPVGQVHVRKLGHGAPVVLLHQTAWSGVQYAHAMPFLAAAGFEVIAVDTPGYGMSDGFDHPPTIAEYAAILPAVFDELGLPRAAVVGHHTGASIGAAFAARYPARVSRLVLHGPPLLNAEERAERLTRPHFDQTPQPDGSHLTRRWEFARRPRAGASAAALQASLVHFFTTGPTEWYGHHAVYQHDLVPELAALTMPTLLLSNTGDHLHKVVPRVQALRPDFAYAEMPGGTYHVIFDEPEAWSAVVAKFLQAEG